MRHALVLASLFLFVAAVGSAKPIQIPRHPDVHNGKIAFSYLGSIWVANENGSSPHRLTVNAAHASDSVENAQREFAIVNPGENNFRQVIEEVYGKA